MPAKKRPQHTTVINLDRASAIERGLDTRPTGTDVYGERRLTRYAADNGLELHIEHRPSKDANYKDTSQFFFIVDQTVTPMGHTYDEVRATINGMVRALGREPKPDLDDVASANRFTRAAPYSVDLPWDCLEDWIARQQRGGKEQVGGGLDLDPDFQRAHVWTREQQSAYVEYVLRGGYAGKELYFNCVGWMKDWRGPFVVVDGKQRLEAVRAFLRDEVPVFGRTRSGYSGTDKMNGSFRVYINDLSTRAEVLQWYLDLNAGGTPHTSNEIERVRNLLCDERIHAAHDQAMGAMAQRGFVEGRPQLPDIDFDCAHCATPLDATETHPRNKAGQVFCDDRCRRLGKHG